MRAEARFVSAGLTAIALTLAGCSSPAPPAADQPAATATATAAEPAATAAAASQEVPTEPVQLTGKDCAKAEAQCGGGVCAVTVDNGCAEPITCSLSMITVCQAPSGMSQVKGKTRDTIAAKNKGKITLSGNCTEGQAASTKVDALECK
jgi:hypothetical protein